MSAAHPASDSSPERLPPDYHQLLFPSQAEPPFLDSAELTRVWGHAWGSRDEVGMLRKVFVRTPGDALAAVRADAWREDVGALVDPDGQWYWTDRQPPDLDQVAAQHAGLCDTLRAEGVEVLVAEALGTPFTKAIYVRDPMISVPGGMVVGRLAPHMRRGEEALVTRALAAQGIPILGTIVGAGTLEGGSFLKLSPTLAALGTSVRVNEAAATQLRSILGFLGMELLTVPLAGFSIHLDLHLLMLDVDKALVDAEHLPHWFPDRLRAEGIEPLWPDPNEPWALNGLTIRPGVVLMAAECPRTAERLRRRGVEVRELPYGEIHKNGGGIHCSTNELLREPAPR